MNVLTQSVNKIDFTANGRRFSFKMTYHADNACDRDMIACFQSEGICEPEVVLAMERIVKEGDIVIDGGANIGFFTLLLSQLVGPKGKVFAIEPGQNNLWKLEENVRINKAKNVEIVRQPLSKDHNPVTFHLRAEGGRNSLFPGHSQSSKTMTPCTLQDFWKYNVKLIKLDIEGAEQAAMQFEGTLSAPFVIAEMNDFALRYMGGSAAEFRQWMEAKWGYATFLLQRDGSLPVLVPRKVNLVTTRQNVNVLFSGMTSVEHAWPEVRV